MRVLLVSQYFWPESFRINELINVLQSEGAEITVLTGQPNYPEGKIFKGYKAFSVKRENHNGYSIIRVPMISRGKAGAIRLCLNYVSFIFSACCYAPWLLRGKKFDGIFVYGLSPILVGLPAILIKKIKKNPLIIWIGDLWPESLASTGYIKNRFILNIIEQVVKFIYQSSDLLLIQSRQFMEPVKKLAGQVPVEYFPNPGEVLFTDRKKMASEPVYKLRKGFNIVFAGNLGSVQALDMILEAAVILQSEKGINIFLFGSGSMAEWLNTEIVAKKLNNIILPGRFPPHNMPDIFDQADVMLVSLVKDETMSLTVPAKLQSYLAAGKPIIAALDGEGARIVIEARAGIACSAEDSVALAKTILELKKQPAEKLNEMGRNGYHYHQENFDSKMLGQRLFNRLQKLINYNE